MTDSTNDRIRQLEAALAECEQERDDAINQKQYASGFMGVEAIERDALRAEVVPIKDLENLRKSWEGMLTTLCGIEEALGRDSSNLAQSLACEMYDGAYLIDDIKKLKANQKFVKDNALFDIRDVTKTLRLVLKSVGDDDDIGYTLGHVIGTLELLAAQLDSNL